MLGWKSEHSLFDTRGYAFYTGMYEHYKQIFFAPIGDDFYHVVGGFGGFGMDGANNVHDEIRPELWGQDKQFLWPDRTYDTFYHINHYSVRYIYRDYFCV